MTRRTVADIRVLKGARKLSLLFVDTLDEARAASEAGVDLLSIIDPLWTAQMREAAGDINRATQRPIATSGMNMIACNVNALQPFRSSGQTSIAVITQRLNTVWE